MVKSNKLVHKLNSTLFLTIDTMYSYLNSYNHNWNIDISVDLKPKNKKDKEEAVLRLVEIINKQKPKLVCFLYNCTFIDELIQSRNQNSFPASTKIIAWHQKHYFPANVVSKLEYIIEYSKIQALKYSKSNQKLAHKYIYLPYPAILPNNYHILFDELSEDIKNKYTGKYIFIGGNNHRDFTSILTVTQKLPEYNFIILSNSPKFLSRFKKHDKNNNKPLDNFKLYTDAQSIEFGYAISQSYICFLPYDTDGCTPGHSVTAQAILFCKPIISCQNCSMDESIINEKTGYLDKVKDIDSYIKHIKLLMEDNNLYKTMLENTKKESHKRSYAYFSNYINNLVDSVIE